MLERILAFFSKVDKFIGPVYRVLFVTGVVITMVTWLAYHAIPIATNAYNWIDSTITDFGPLIQAPSPTTRLLLSLMLGALAGIVSIGSEYARVQQVRLQITDEIRRCTASHIKYYDELFTLITGVDLQTDTKIQMISEISRNHSIFLCSRLAEIFALVTKGPCHASIKSYNAATGMVTTRTRDALMHNHDRSTADDFRRSYQCKDNTAFQYILTDPKADLFLNSHLRLSAFLGRYDNANPDWAKNYSATVVAPLTQSRSAATINSETVLGFVCVDNKRGHFPPRYSKAVLSVFVVLITDMMVKLGEWKPTEE